MFIGANNGIAGRPFDNASSCAARTGLLFKPNSISSNSRVPIDIIIQTISRVNRLPSSPSRADQPHKPINKTRGQGRNNKRPLYLVAAVVNAGRCAARSALKRAPLTISSLGGGTFLISVNLHRWTSSIDKIHLNNNGPQ